ncbi:histidine phosphatase family protein [Rhizobium sp. Leaf262]|uniref:SixA phosphatase family protein n=1 Tax=Rhizobium sp. Leaf262 TaxID=1736312 RepID=UPI000712EA10|nr:histidine phosphatase family protein [Rhizobium sp. Leaf262]KQO81279.1 phosphohistidine phosphatase [Rhizobium sp. Leaf262]
MNEPSPLPSRVYLLRHAHAAWAGPGERDFDRPLDDAGYAEAEVVADRAADAGYLPDVVISSTALRCRQTAQAVRRAFNDRFDVDYVDEMYNAEVDTYLALISAQSASRSVMLVGHNPTIEAVAEAMIGKTQIEAHLPSGFPTAGLAVLDAQPSPDGDGVDWRLTAFLSP